MVGFLVRKWAGNHSEAQKGISHAENTIKIFILFLSLQHYGLNIKNRAQCFKIQPFLHKTIAIDPHQARDNTQILRHPPQTPRNANNSTIHPDHTSV